MSKFIPDYVFDSIFDITPELLKRHGIRAALIDLDGTMVSHKTALPTDEVASFVRRLEDAGIDVYSLARIASMSADRIEFVD